MQLQTQSKHLVSVGKHQSPRVRQDEVTTFAGEELGPDLLLEIAQLAAARDHARGTPHRPANRNAVRAQQLPVEGRVPKAAPVRLRQPPGSPKDAPHQVTTIYMPITEEELAEIERLNNQGEDA